MLKWTIRILLGLAALCVAVVAFGWSVLAVPYFSEFRRTLVSKVLSEQIGQPLIVNGDVSVVVGRTSRVRAQGVQIPSENIADIDLAKLDNFDFEINLLALLDRKIDLNNLFVDGLQVNLLVTEDGTTSFNEREKDAIGYKSQAPKEETNDKPDEDARIRDGQGGLIAFLRSRTVSFTNIGLVIDDATTGFEYDFSLNEFTLDQIENGSTLIVASDGTVNGQPFVLEGNYPNAAPFSTRAEFGTALFTFDGEPLPAENGGGFVGQLDFDIVSIGDLLDVLKLKRSLDGSGSLSARIENKAGTTAALEILAELELAKGQLISLSGDIENLDAFDGIDLQVDTRLHPENAPPPRATELAELKLTQTTTRIVSQQDGVELDGLVLSTNAFEHDLETVGPVSIGRIRRTSEGTLALERISLQAGPLDDPILQAHGDIHNVLELNNLAFAGEVNAPASFFLIGLDDAAAEAFGGVVAEFEIDDATGVLRVTRLVGQAVDTDVWSMAADIKVGDVKTFDGLAADFSLGIASGAEFLAALGLEPVDTGALELNLSVSGEDSRWNGEFGLAAGTSSVNSSVSFGDEEGRPTIRSSVISDRLALADLEAARSGLIELAKIGKQTNTAETDASENSADQDANEVELQPLVLPETTTEGEAGKKSANPDKNGGEKAAEPEMERIVKFNEFLKETDIYGTIEFREISGVRGVTSLASELVSEGGKARLGPVEFTYGSGYFNFEAQADVIEAPQYVSLAGATSGWTLAELLKIAGVSFDADGDLSGRFNVSGNLSSVETFLETMVGSATVEMLDGKVATSLLELAGLGIFPWLFSDEFRQGYTDVVCVNVPVNIDRGAIAFDQVVAETKSVQLVAKGGVNVKQDTISMRAEPRPVGKPLARSAWPFEVFGKLSDPRFKLDIGGSRSERADGADVMPSDRTPCQPDILQLQ